MRKTSITLRRRLMPSGRTRLFLDIVCNGRRKFETLGLFLEPETTKAIRVRNQDTLRLAEEICAKRIVEARNVEFGFGRRAASDVYFCSYFESIANNCATEHTRISWMTCLGHIRNYDKHHETLTFADITDDWANGFVRYLSEARTYNGGQLSESSKRLYIAKLLACMRQAVKDRIISADDVCRIENMPKNKTEHSRVFLTLEELRRVSACPCPKEVVKDAFLFSCLTGLRFVDVSNLRWTDITEQSGFMRIVFSQQKTGQREYLDINQQAAAIIRKQPKDAERVFALVNNINVNKILAAWMQSAGIEKHISFHCARHTFAVMMLDLGTDIYTVSKLLGHTDIKTTQIYAKVLDKNKQAAVAKIPDILPE